MKAECPKCGGEIDVSDAWGHGYDAGFTGGRAEALGSGVAGLEKENERLRKALRFIGRRGDPPPASVCKRVAREALDRSGIREERREKFVKERSVNRERRNHMWREGRTVEPTTKEQRRKEQSRRAKAAHRARKQERFREENAAFQKEGLAKFHKGGNA